MTRSGRGSEAFPAQWHHFIEFVRRALHAVADQIEPQADGLERIRARIWAGAGPRDQRATPEGGQGPEASTTARSG
jgi:hypothetical protein